MLSLVLIVSLLPGLGNRASAIAYNEVAGPRLAGDLTSYIYGDFVTEGDWPSPFGHVNPWSSFDWLSDGETISLAYSGPFLQLTDTEYDVGMGDGYFGTANVPESAESMNDLVSSALMILIGGASKDVRVYFFNTTSDLVNVSFHIQSTSGVGFAEHSVASITTPEGRTFLDDKDTESEDQNRSADFAFTLKPYEGDALGNYNGDSGDQESKRPADDPETGFAPAGCFYISLSTAPNLGDDPSAGVIISSFYAGADSDTLSTITLQSPEHGAYTATATVPDGEGTMTVTETVTSGGEDKSFSYLPANGFTLSAAGDSDYEFDYWSNNGNVISYDAEFATRAYRDGSTVVASFLPKTQVRAFEVSGTRYVSWAEAVAAAQTADAPIVLKKDYTFASNTEELVEKGDAWTLGVLENDGGLINYIVPSGVKFVVPYHVLDTGTFVGGPDFSVLSPGTPYCTLTVPSGAAVTVFGRLNVNAASFANNTTSFMGGAAGDYGFIDLDGVLNVDNGGELRAFGYIAGPGRVNILSGGASYEVLQMADWGGGSYAMSWKNHVDENTLRESAFYFSQYYVQNVESDYRVYAGADAYVFGHLTASMGDGENATKILANVPCGFIGDGDTLFTIMENGYIERRYDGTSDRIAYDVHGNMEAKAITVDVMNIATVASEQWLLGLTSNMDVIASEGKTTLSYGYMILPDTRVVVEEGAEVEIAPTARVHIWRLDDWQAGFVGSTHNSTKKLVPIRYTVANGTTQVRTALSHSGTLINNGTVTAYSNVFTTDNGGSADDMVIQGTGTLINRANPNGTPSGTLSQLKNSHEWVTINTQPVLSYMYGETGLDSFETGTYYSKRPSVDTHGNGTYDSWYQWQVDYTLTDQYDNVINYTDYASGSDNDLNGELIADGHRYVVTSIDSILDADTDADLSAAISFDGDATIGGLAVNKNASIADGWEVVDFHGIAQDIKVTGQVKEYDHRVVWNEELGNGTTQTSAEYVTGSSASYEWDHVYAVEAAVVPANGATAAVVTNSQRTILNLTDISEDVDVNIAASTDYHPVIVQVTYPDSNTINQEFTIYSTETNGVWTAAYAPEKPAVGYDVIGSITLNNGTGVGVVNNQDSMTLTGVVTDNVTAVVKLVHKDFRVGYNVTLNTEGRSEAVSLAPSFINTGTDITFTNDQIDGADGASYVFGSAEIVTTPTNATLTASPTSLVLSGVDKDLTVNIPVDYYDYTVSCDGQTAYVLDGGSAAFTLDTGYAINNASIPSNQTGAVSYVNPETPEGAASVTVSDVGSDVDVSLDKVHFDAVVNFRKGNDELLATKYWGEGTTVTYTAVDGGADSGNRFFIGENGASSDDADVEYTQTTVSVSNVTGNSADVTVDLRAFTYKVTWNDGVETTYTYLTGTDTEATYLPPDEGVGGDRYIIQTGYGEHASGATNNYPATNGKSQFTVANINADEVVTLTLNTYTYKVVFTDQNDNVLKTQYSDAESHDVTINTGDNTIRYNVAGQDFISSKNTIITSADITGTATVNNGVDFGEGVQLVTLTGLGSDVTAKLEVYEYDHKVIVVLNDLNGWSSDTEIHYIAGDTYEWTKPAGAEYNLDSVSSTYGTASKSGDTVSLNLTDISEVEVELAITTVLTAERLKEDLSQFSNATSSAGAVIEVTDSAYGVFTVTCSKACVVAIDYGDGNYERMTAVPTGESNVYEFTCPKNFEENISILVGVKGDATGDGKVNALDFSLVKKAANGTALTGIKYLCADVVMFGKINALDVAQIKKAANGTALNW